MDERYLTPEDDGALIERLDQEARFDRALERLDAEVAAHEGDDELVCAACGRPYALHGIECPTLSGPAPDNGVDGTTGLSFRAAPAWDAPGADPSGIGAGAEFRQDDPEEARFGERVRKLWLRHPDLEAAGLRLVLSDLAAAIDRDARDLTEEALINGARHQTYFLRRRVEEAVEELRFSAIVGLLESEDAVPREIVDAEDLLARLPGIFGHGDEPEPATDPEGRLVGHEPAHDRRERESARREDSTGRVEGVDR